MAAGRAPEVQKGAARLPEEHYRRLYGGAPAPSSQGRSGQASFGLV